MPAHQPTHLTPVKRPPLTTTSVNEWFKSTLADPVRKSDLKQDWIKLLLSEIAATPEQEQSFRSLPAADAKELQAAIAQVVEHGGTIHIDHPSETGPSKLMVQPAIAGGQGAGFTLGIFHCTFDAYFRHWHCGWGPRLSET